LKVNRLLAGTLALVLVAGLGTPAFADQATDLAGGRVIESTQSDVALPQTVDPEDIVYENGVTDPDNGRFIDFVVVADDFILEEDTSITDFHFVLIDTTEPFGFDGPYFYEIREDASGSPGTPITDGFSTNLEQEAIEDSPLGSRFLVHFDFEEPIPLDASTTYWVVLHAGPLDDLTSKGLGIEMSNPPLIGNPAHIHFGDGNFIPATFDNWFQITAKEQVVGGEFLPIDSTALMLAGLQTSAIWMLPVLAGVAGAGFYLIKFRTNKE